MYRAYTQVSGVPASVGLGFWVHVGLRDIGLRI